MATFFKKLSAAEAPPTWGLLAALLAVVMAFVFMALAGTALALLFTSPQDPAALLTGWLIGGTLLIGYIWLTQRTAEARAALRLERSRLPLLIAFGVGFGAAITLDLVAILFAGRVLPPPELATLGVPASAQWLRILLFMLIVQPVAEELLFRGMLYPSLRAAQGVWAAIITSAAFYGVFHQLLYAANIGGAAGLWYNLLEPTLVGVALGGVRAYSQSTRAAVVAHIGVSVFALLKFTLVMG